ncbi:MAG: amino acid ABC transporter permease [Bifidobacteriaceae bacterium]|nr:amino acid ABC transporter permease [Bifidobacteriaceae bacterium]
MPANQTTPNPAKANLATPATAPNPATPTVVPPSRRRLTARQRSALSTGVQYVVLAGVLAAVLLAVNWQQLGSKIFTLAAVRAAAPQIPIAFGNTLRYTLGAFVVSLSLGLILALMRLSSVRLYRWLATAYIEFFRGLPALLIVFAVAYGVPMALGVKIPGVALKAALALGVVSSAYMAESLRAGLQAVPKGQVEAARSLGLSHLQTLGLVVIPQAFRIVLPPVTNEIVLLTKDTSLVYVMGLTVADYELAKLARESLAEPVGGLTALFVIGACYLIITLPLGFLARRMERSFGKAKV